ncbi:MAG: hypothetical protein NT022_12660 [Deltaproteobacteria bacterium]|nr:hypothetical protein [Deltaproteobacteria bacterium]
MSNFTSVLEQAGILLLINLGIMLLYILRQDFVNKFGHLSEGAKKLDTADLDNRIRKILGIIIATRGCPPPPLLEKNLIPTRLSAICKHYGLPGTIAVSIRFADTGGPPASIQCQNRGDYVIKIHPKYEDNYGTHSALLAHECAHIWADIFYIKPSCVEDLERDIDVLAVLLGAGSLILGGMNQKADFYSNDGSVGVSINTETLGYLTLAEYAYVMAAYVHFLGVDPNEMLEHLPPVSYRAYQKFRTRFEESPKCIQLNKSDVIFRCNYCKKKLRTLRKNGIKVIVACPICRAEFSLKTSSISTKLSTKRFLKVTRATLPFNAPPVI